MTNSASFENLAPYRFLKIGGNNKSRVCRINRVLIGCGYHQAGDYSNFDSIFVDFGEKLTDTVFPRFANCRYVIFRSDYQAKQKVKHITSIPEYNFYNSTISGVGQYTGSVKRIGTGAFENATLLSGYGTPNGVEVIEPNTFKNARIPYFAIGKSVKEIKESAFEGASVEKGIKINMYDYKTSALNIIRKKAFCNVKHVGDFEGGQLNEDDLKLPEGLQIIEDSAFYNSEIVIWEAFPASLKLIGTRAFARCYTSRNDLRYCTQLDSIGDEAFASVYALKPGFGLCNYYAPDTKNLKLGKGIYRSNNRMGSIEINDDITHIPDSMFTNCKVLYSCTLHDGIRSIGKYAFSGCFPFSSPDIFPKNLEYVDDYACSNCKTVDAEFPNDHTRFGEGVFSNCGTIGKCILPKQLERLPPRMFYKAGWNDRYSKNKSNVTMPPTITDIGTAAFAFCGNLKDLQLPDSLIEIADSAFFDSHITELTFNARLKRIGDMAFSRNLIKSAVMPESLAHIGMGLFEGCDSLTSVSFPKDLQQMDCDRMFEGCIKLRQIILNFENPEIMQNMQGLFGNRTASDTEYHSPVIIHVPYGCLNKFRELQQLFDFVIVKEMNPDGSTSVDDLKDSDADPFVLDGDMSLKNAAGMHVTVFSVDGRTVFSSPAYNGEPLPLTRKKLYLISINGTTSKIIP